MAPRQAGGNGTQGPPPAVSAASLAQQGEDLVWQVELSVPFSPGALAADGRRLCLVLSEAARPSAWG